MHDPPPGRRGDQRQSATVRAGGSIVQAQKNQLSAAGESVSASTAVTVAVDFVWLGMVLAISFLEAPLKFRAPNVTLPIGLGIGRLVFRALNAVEVVFALVIATALVLSPSSVPVTSAVTVAIVVLVVQVGVLRPRLTRRTDHVLAGLDAPRSREHLIYIGLEVLKSVALIAGGVLLLSG